jgi:hypothetical protein
MDAQAKQAFIRQAALANAANPNKDQVLWSQHGLGKLVAEALTRVDVENALATCEVIEDYPPAHRPFPDCPVLGLLSPAQPVHAVIALDEPNGRIFLVTLYRPDPARWHHDWRTRR